MIENEYVDWLREQLQAVYDELDKANRKITGLEKELNRYRAMENALKNADALKHEHDDYERKLTLIRDVLNGSYYD